MAHQDYLTHFEPSQSLGGAKMEDSQEKPPDHPQAELGLPFPNTISDVETTEPFRLVFLLCNSSLIGLVSHVTRVRFKPTELG